MLIWGKLNNISKNSDTYSTRKSFLLYTFLQTVTILQNKGVVKPCNWPGKISAQLINAIANDLNIEFIERNSSKTKIVMRTMYEHSVTNNYLKLN